MDFLSEDLLPDNLARPRNHAFASPAIETFGIIHIFPLLRRISHVDYAAVGCNGSYDTATSRSKKEGSERAGGDQASRPTRG